MNTNQDGVRLCLRYAFGPNSFHYCGPEKQSDLAHYLKTGASDGGLKESLLLFETMYPYLRLIASENSIPDAFDPRVVEAYFIGNTLLETVRKRAFFSHAKDRLRIPQRMKQGVASRVIDNVVSAVPHHTVHVMGIMMRTGHAAVPHTLSTMDSCRISWGTVLPNPQQKLPIENESDYSCMVRTRPLEFAGSIIQLGRPIEKVARCIGITPKPGDIVSMHWGYVCTVLSARQRQFLSMFTQLALRTSEGII